MEDAANVARGERGGAEIERTDVYTKPPATKGPDDGQKTPSVVAKDQYFHLPTFMRKKSSY
jgi:hypothetical protein